MGTWYTGLRKGTKKMTFMPTRLGIWDDTAHSLLTNRWRKIIRTSPTTLLHKQATLPELQQWNQKKSTGRTDKKEKKLKQINERIIKKVSKWSEGLFKTLYVDIMYVQQIRLICIHNHIQLQAYVRQVVYLVCKTASILFTRLYLGIGIGDFVMQLGIGLLQTAVLLYTTLQVFTTFP